ncbi:MAG: hypothetical protein AAGI51_11660 [Pseudomonadota bacterium]
MLSRAVRALRSLPAVRAAALVLGTAGAAAADRVGPAEFERLTEGRVLTFFVDEAPYGAEAYLPGREVIWQNAAGACLFGRWEGRGEDICFTYDDAPEETVCWAVERDAEGLTAAMVGDPLGLRLRFGPERPQALVCEPDPGT